MCKIIVVGDPHFKTNNIEETNQMTKEILQYIDQIKPDALVCLGDVLDRHETIHVGPLLRSIEFLQSISLKTKLYVLIGNHDRPNNNVFMTDEHPFTALKVWPNTKIVDSTIEDFIEGKRFIFVPYVSPGRFDEALKDFNINNTSCVFAHQEFYGAKMGAVESVVGDKWSIDHPLVVSGHIHDFQRIQDNIIYTGTPIQHAYGDSEDKGIFVFTFDDGFKFEKLAIGIPMKKIAKFNVSEINLIKKLDPKHHYKIIISGTVDEIKSLKLGGLTKHLSKFNIAYKTLSTIGNFQNIHSDIENKDFLELLYDEVKSVQDINDRTSLAEVFIDLFGSVSV